MTISREDLSQRLLPILCAQGIGLTCGVVGVRLTSHLVEPVDYGNYGVFSSLASVGVGVIYAGLVKFVSRHWQGAADRAGLLREVLVATAAKTPWLLAAAIAAALLVAPGRKAVYGGLLFAGALLMALTQLAQSALQAARQHWRDLGVSSGVSVVRSFAPPLLYGATGAGLVALLGGFLLQALLGALLGFWNLRRWWFRAAPLSVGRMLTPVYEGPRFVTLAAAAWMLTGLNRWLVAWFFGSETAGYFTLAGNIGTILPGILGAILLLFFQPQWFARAVDDPPARHQLLRDVDRVALFHTAGALALTAILRGAMPWLIGPLVNVRYTPAAMFVLATGCYMTSITTGFFFHAMLLAARRERACTAADLGGAGCLIVGGVLSAAAGVDWFKAWLGFSPLVPWLVNRTLARRAVAAPA